MLGVFLECSRTLLFRVQSLQSVSYGVLHSFQSMVSSSGSRLTKIFVNKEEWGLPWVSSLEHLLCAPEEAREPWTQSVSLSFNSMGCF